MRDLGLREWTALAALVFGVLLGFVFLDPASGGSEGPLPLRYGDTPTTEPTATATPVPAEPLPVLEGWEVTFATIRDGVESPDAARALPTLDLSFERAPFPDYRDNSWRVTARTAIDLGPGVSGFVLRYDAALRVFVNDRELLSRGEPANGPEEVSVQFAHDEGRVEIRVEATDEAGPFLLEYVTD